MAGGIFVSYRRDDSRHAAGRLLDRLRQTYEPHQLFMDVDNVAPGLDFVKVLSEQVTACDAMLVVIGPNWLDARDEEGARRLDNSHDFVRIEVEAALARDVRVIPVLVDGAPVPREDALPEPLRPLARRQSVRLTHERFGSEADILLRSLRDVVQLVGKRSGAGRPIKPPSMPTLATTATLRGMAVGVVGLMAGFALFFCSMMLIEVQLGGPLLWPAVTYLALLAIAWFLAAAGAARGAAYSTLWEVASAASCAAAWFTVAVLGSLLYTGGRGSPGFILLVAFVATGAYALSIRLYLWKVWKVIVGGPKLVQR